jgi:hypothetical protein
LAATPRTDGQTDGRTDRIPKFNDQNDRGLGKNDQKNSQKIFQGWQKKKKSPIKLKISANLF